MTNQQRFTLAFGAIGGTSWVGGLNYLQNIVIALNSLNEAERPYLKMVAPTASEVDKFSTISALLDETMPSPGKGAVLPRVLNRLRRKKQDVSYGPFLRAHNVDCLFGIGNFGPGFSIPLLSWIPDFQHLHLPEMFTDQEIAERNYQYTESARLATRIIVTSDDVKQDFQRFAPQSADKVRVISGVSQVPSEIYDINPSRMCEQYSLPPKFFYVPNQFWKHKNHELVIEALITLQATHPDIVVVCTGHTHDERHPRNFGHLLTLIAQNGLRNNFIILGMIPLADTLQLIRQSLAVLQPSLFEGWSNAVAEAKSVGKTIMLSDIPVHREHNPQGAIYFDPQDSAGLARAMQFMYDHGKPGPDLKMEEAARCILHARTQQFGNEFAAIAREALC